MATVQPDIVMLQLTDLSLGLEPRQIAEAIGRNARIRIEGTKNLVAAALVAGIGRMIAQSIAWAYAPGARPYSENDHLDLDAEGTPAISVRVLRRSIDYHIATSRGRRIALRSIVRSRNRQ